MTIHDIISFHLKINFDLTLVLKRINNSFLKTDIFFLVLLILYYYKEKRFRLTKTEKISKSQIEVM